MRPTEMNRPNSELTLERPDIWLRGMELATSLTGYSFPAKVPAADGAILACGGYTPPIPRPLSDAEKDRIVEIDKEMEELFQRKPDGWMKKQQEIDHEKDAILWKKVTLSAPVPEGAIDWLLHEAGHFIAASPIEQCLPDYGFDTFPNGSGIGVAREWQAWAFEEIILAPFGPARALTPPSYRGGTGYTKPDIPHSAFAHIEQRMREQKVDIEPWRILCADWFAWGVSKGDEAPWKH